MLRDCGVDVRTLDINRQFPDGVFIEDTAIVLDELAVLTSMGAESRRLEPAGIEPELRKYREVHRIQFPAAIEGGDVLIVNRTLLVGVSLRTNLAGINALTSIVQPYGYRVLPVPVHDCLHLKSACSALPDDRLMVNPAWLDMTALQGFAWLHVPESEPWGANLALAGDSVCLPSDHIETANLIRDQGFEVRTADVSEFAKAEGGVTCLSLRFNAA